jgi:hypothetical protein
MGHCDADRSFQRAEVGRSLGTVRRETRLPALTILFLQDARRLDRTWDTHPRDKGVAAENARTVKNALIVLTRVILNGGAASSSDKPKILDCECFGDLPKPMRADHIST